MSRNPRTDPVVGDSAVQGHGARAVRWTIERIERHRNSEDIAYLHTAGGDFGRRRLKAFTLFDWLLLRKHEASATASVTASGT